MQRSGGWKDIVGVTMQPQASMRNGGIKRLGGLVVLIGVVALGRIGWGAQEDNYTIRDPDATVQGQQQAMEAELSRVMRMRRRCG